jgi:hypothetical protein
MEYENIIQKLYQIALLFDPGKINTTLIEFISLQPSVEYIVYHDKTDADFRVFYSLKMDHSLGGANILVDLDGLKKIQFYNKNYYILYIADTQSLELYEFFETRELDIEKVRQEFAQLKALLSKNQISS